MMNFTMKSSSYVDRCRWSMLSGHKFRLINHSLSFPFLNNCPCLIKDRFQDFIDPSRYVFNRILAPSPIFSTDRNGCGKSSKINAGSMEKSLCSFKMPCRDGIGIDCSLSVTRSLQDRKFRQVFSVSNQLTSLQYSMMLSVLFDVEYSTWFI